MASTTTATPPRLTRSQVEEIVRQVVSERLAAPRDGAPALVVHASARHAHLCREDLDRLFGPSYELTVERPLYQPGNFAAKETVTLIGPRSRVISNLRILGPCRNLNQVELAYTDAIALGFDIPLRASGDIKGTPGAMLMGPNGFFEMPDGIIRALRHAHLSPTDAHFYGVKHGDLMKLKIGGGCGITLDPAGPGPGLSGLEQEAA